MANDIQDRIGQILGSDSARALAGTAVTEALKAVSSQRPSKRDKHVPGLSTVKHLPGSSGVRSLAAGAGAAAVAPVAIKGISKLIKGDGISALAGGPKHLAEEATSKLGDAVTGKAKEKLDEAGGPSGILKNTVKSALPFGDGESDGDGAGGKNDAQGVGKGRRMPIQQTFDVGLPLETVYNQWTQFEEWPKFMHRVKRVSQDGPCKVSFAVKIWGRTKEFTAEIETQRPDDRIKWKTSQGMTHSGVVMFRELGPNLTRVILSFDLDPGSLLEKYARGARYVKRAARADVHRFTAFIEMLEHETGAWRGVIEDGKLVEDHDPSYDEDREYGDADELVEGRGSKDDDDSDSREDEDEARGTSRPSGRSRTRQASSTRAASRSGSASRSAGGSSRGNAGASNRSRRSGSSSSARKSSGTTRSRSSKNGSGNGGSSRASSRPSGRSSGSGGSRRAGGGSNGSSASGTRSSGRTRSRSTGGRG